MTAHPLAETRLVDGLSAKQLLEGLSRVYRWLMVTDASRRVLWVSEGIRDLFGVDVLEIGNDARDFVPKLPRPEQVFSLRSDLRHRSHLASVPLDLRTRDGRVVPVDVSVLKLDTLQAGGPLLVAVARPVDDGPRRHADDALHREIVDQAPTAIVAVDADGFVQHANPAAARLTGRETAELIGYPAALLFGDSAADVERIAASFGEAAPQDCRVSVQRPGGGSTSVDVTVRTLCSEEERPGKVLFLHEVQPDGADVGEARGREELVRANEELEHCVTSLAHDLRSPLVALLGFSRLLRQEYESLLDETGRHFLHRIEQAGRTMESLVHDLLELSRIGQSGERPAMVDPRAVLAQLRGELKPRLDETGIELVLPDLPPPLVYCDRTRLYQIFSNLIGNAIDHMGDPRDPRITVEVRDTDEGHLLTVRDNGRGIPASDLPHIFEAFQSFARKEGRRGTGMGLAIVKKIAEKCGGRAWAESEPGCGAAFHVLLPGR